MLEKKNKFMETTGSFDPYREALSLTTKQFVNLKNHVTRLKKVKQHV